jgi:RpiB/LacA/LacB family sugar-phosphate isomerase
MRVALGSDERAALTDALAAWLRERGYELTLHGALREGADDAWPAMAREVGREVASGAARFGIACCWTGTGASIAANKVRGVRAALCADAATAAGAREWNDANVLALSLRATSIAIAHEILEAWFAGAPTHDARYREMIASVREADEAERC